MRTPRNPRKGQAIKLRCDMTFITQIHQLCKKNNVGMSELIRSLIQDEYDLKFKRT